MSIARLGAVFAILALAAALAGCGEKDEPDLAGTTSATTTTGSEIPGFAIEGTWSGELPQANLKPFRVTATIGSLQDPAQNTVSYTGINCNGNWTYLGRQGTAYRFREQITGGKGGSCKGKGIVTLNPFDTDGVDYDFQGGGVQSAGVLARVTG
ncbi:MAG: hypothetical protein ACXWZK_09295 [Solirubrobacterales bacterium]